MDRKKAPYLSKYKGFLGKLDNYFRISERGSTFKTEVIAGLTTFFAMAYIVILNPDQLTSFAKDVDPELKTIWYAVYVASILAAVVGTLLMALYAKMPFAQACGMGLNSFFCTTFVAPALILDDETGYVVGIKEAGTALQGYKEGLAVILLSGLLFMVLSLTGARTYIAKSLPDCLKKSIPAGIGLFIAFIGLKGAGVITANPFTFVQLFDFHAANWASFVPVLITIVGLCVMAVLTKFNVKGSVIITILGSTGLYYLMTWTPPKFDIGDIGASFVAFGQEGFFSAFEGFKTLFTDGGAFSATALFNVIALTITFCLVDMFDTMGTLYGAASQANMLDENGDPINLKQSMNSDSIATVSGAVLGTSTCTTFVESSAGVGAGGRTGFASIITTICFVACLFLTPLATIIPTCATAPALIFIGVLMLKSFAKVDMEDISSAVPAFLTLILMPLTYSISNGIAVGAISYVFIRLCTGKYQKKDIVITIIAVLFGLRYAFVPMF